MEPIKISVEDNSKHTQIAFLVDREDFRNDVVECRKNLTLKLKPLKIPLTSSDFETWFNLLKQRGLSKDSLLRDNKLIRQLSNKARILIQKNRKTEAKRVVKDLDIVFRRWQEFDFKKDVNNLLRRYKVPSTSFIAIARAVMCSQIQDSDWSYCEAVLEPYDIKPEETTPSRMMNEPNCLIKVTPYLATSELASVFEKIKMDVIKLYRASPCGYKIYAGDTVSNIKRDRIWYWQKTIEKLSYGQILKLALKNGEKISRQGVIDAIQRYRKNLE